MHNLFSLGKLLLLTCIVNNLSYLYFVLAVGAPAMRSFGMFEVSKLAVSKKETDNYLDIILGTHITGRSSIRLSLFIDGKIIAVTNYAYTFHYNVTDGYKY